MCAPEYVGARVSRDRMCMSWAPATASFETTFGGDGRVHGTPTYLVGLCPLLSLSRVSSTVRGLLSFGIFVLYNISTHVAIAFMPLAGARPLSPVSYLCGADLKNLPRASSDIRLPLQLSQMPKNRLLLKGPLTPS